MATLASPVEKIFGNSTLGSRLGRCLELEGIRTTQDLATKTRADILKMDFMSVIGTRQLTKVLELLDSAINEETILLTNLKLPERVIVARLFKFLKAINIKRVFQLVQKTETELVEAIRFPNWSTLGLRRITEGLARYDLSLGMELCPTIIEKLNRDIDPIVVRISNSELSGLVDRAGIEVKAVLESENSVSLEATAKILVILGRALRIVHS